ncbi:hypothetical protein [Fonticella tunisiensis]|uniref:Uncharacterized protein n=1 Tax=Fonticella tunisiensis TaxID=1096341 RepID=A0A4R7KR10_9CLOT|nr:hypothetical protein [Fonticella tunisiensis]TDT61166.1 hypothetical protein EDD71_10864 [Fonticella tunisiensis]
MTDKEKIIMFEKYMRDRGFDEEVIQYNLLVVKILSQEVLRFFNQGLESIDTYSFEEFTDMVRIIDEHLGGRNGIKRMLNAMLELTEFLKENKLIKGGKIAHYKRMFSDVDYYMDKYDMMTGRKDNTKDFIKMVTNNRFSSQVIKVVEYINVYEFKTLDRIDKILNDVPLSKEDLDDEIPILISILTDLELLEVKNGALEATKKGRGISRLSAEKRYGALLYLMLYSVDWESIIKSFFKDDEYMGFNDMISILASIFRKEKEVSIDHNTKRELTKEEVLIEISSEQFRMARVDSLQYSHKIFDICFTGMGLVDVESKNGRVTYRVSDFSQEIFKLIYLEATSDIKDKIESIGYLIKNKRYDMAEKKILNYITVYGGNTIIWDYLGQLLLLKKSYRYAYMVLKHGYEKSSKRGRASKSLLYHLILCCRKLRIKEDMKVYEEKLQAMERA